MVDFLADYRRKHARAMLHFETLDKSVKKFTERVPELVASEFDADSGQHVFRIRVERSDPHWAVALGDCVYNLRASLDYTITALVRSAGNEENDSTEFPIFGMNPTKSVSWREVDAWWETDMSGLIAKKLRDTPPITKAVLKRLQPFYGVPSTNPDDHPLAWLQAMSNRDKHRRLNLPGKVASFEFVDAERKPIFDFPGPYGRLPISETDEVDAKTVTLSGYSKKDVDVYLLPTYDVMLEEPMPLFGRSLIETVTGIYQFIDRRVLPAIRSLM